MQRRIFQAALIALFIGTPALSQNGAVVTSGQIRTPAPEADPDAPAASVVVTTAACFAPCYAHFDARETTDPQLSDRDEYLLDLEYAWDFGDTASPGNWSYGALRGSKNVDEGFVAAHIYETAGTYNWTLTVTDADGNTDVETGQVVVTAQNDTFPTMQTICVPDTGSDYTGCPAGATQASANADFDAIWNTVCNIDEAASATRCLVKRGGTYALGTTVSRSTSAHTMVGAYGSGAKPIVNITTQLMTTSGGVTHRFLMSDLDVRGNDALDGVGITAQPANNPYSDLMFVRVDATNMSSPWGLYAGDSDFDPDVPSTMPRRAVLYEVTTYSTSSDGANNDVFIGAEYFAILGSRIGDKDGDEHVIRSGWSLGSVISHNDLGNNVGDLAGCGTIRHIMKMHNNKVTETASHNREFVISDNRITACDGNDTQIAIGNKDAGSPNEACINWLFSRNWSRDLYNGSGIVHVKAHTGPGRISGNIIDGSEPALGGTIRGVYLQELAAPQLVEPDDIRIYGNTFFKDADFNETMLAIVIDPDSSGTIIKNNLAYDPGADISLTSGTGVGTVLCSGGLITPCNLDTGTNPFVGSTFTTLADFELHGTSAARDIGELLPFAGINFTGTGKPEVAEADLDAGAYQR